MASSVRFQRLIPALLFALLVGAISVPAGADEFYRWVDEKGRKHFSDSYYDVPEKFRDQIEKHRDDFDAGARVSVVEGLDERYAPKLPEGEQAAAAPAKPAFDPEKFMGPDGPNWDEIQKAVGPISTVWIVGMVAALLAMLFVGVALAAFMLKVACTMVGMDEPPTMLRAMGVILLQGVLGMLAQTTLQVALIPDPQNISPSSAIGLVGLNTGVGFALNIAVLRGLVTETLGKAIGVQITLILMGFALAIGFLILGLAASCVAA